MGQLGCKKNTNQIKPSSHICQKQYPVDPHAIWDNVLWNDESKVEDM